MEIAGALPELREEFARGPDEIGLCRTLQLEAAMHWEHARSAAAEDAWQRAAEYARRANDRRQLTDILGWLASAALWGPTPAAEGIRRCEGYLDEIGNHHRGQAVVLLHMAGLYAMRDEVEIAHATLNRAKSHLDCLGPTMTAAIIQPAAFIAMLAGDPATAEMHLRFEYESLKQMGETGVLVSERGFIDAIQRGSQDRTQPGRHGHVLREHRWLPGRYTRRDIVLRVPDQWRHGDVP